MEAANRTRGTGHKVQLGRFRSDIRKFLLMRRVMQCWNSSPERL